MDGSHELRDEAAEADALREKMLLSLSREVAAEAAKEVQGRLAAGTPDAEADALREKMLLSLSREVAAEAAKEVQGRPAASPSRTRPSSDVVNDSLASQVADPDYDQLVSLEALNQTLRRAGFAWRRANRAFESKARRMLLMHRIRPPAYAPGVLLPAPSLLSFLATSLRASLFFAAGVVARHRPQAEAYAQNASNIAAGAQARVTQVCSSAWQALPAAARERAASAIAPTAAAAAWVRTQTIDRIVALWGKISAAVVARLQACGVDLDSPRSVLGESAYAALEEAAAPWRDTRVRRDKLGSWASWLRSLWRRFWSLSMWAFLFSVFGLLFLSEVCLLFQFPQLYSWSPAIPPLDAPDGFTPTPIGWVLSLGRGPESVYVPALFLLGVTLLLSCSWSLNQLEMGLFWYRMVRPYATDTASVAFNAAIFCRIAVVLVLNVDMMVLPLEADGLRTSQTRFYCQFAKKGRLTIPSSHGHDYYLVAMPLLITLLVLALYCNLLSRIKAACARFLHDERVPTFRFGRSIVTWHEERGAALLHNLDVAYNLWAHATIANAWRRKLTHTRKEVDPEDSIGVEELNQRSQESRRRRRLSAAGGPVGSAQTSPRSPSLSNPASAQSSPSMSDGMP